MKLSMGKAELFCDERFLGKPEIVYSIQNRHFTAKTQVNFQGPHEVVVGKS